MKLSMNRSERDKPISCSEQCSKCGEDQQTEAGNLHGWRLVLPAVTVFLLPLAFAVGGMIVARSLPFASQSEVARAGVAVISLIVGIVIAIVVMRQIRPIGKENS